MHPCPDIIMGKIIANSYSIYINTSVVNNSGGNITVEQKDTVTTCILSRFLFLLGQVSLCNLLYVEKISIFAKKVKESDKSKTCLSGTSQVGGEGAEEKTEQDSMEAEMGMAAAVDAEHDKVREIYGYLLSLTVIYSFM